MDVQDSILHVDRFLLILHRTNTKHMYKPKNKKKSIHAISFILSVYIVLRGCNSSTDHKTVPSSPLNKVSLLQKEYVEEGQTEIQSEF